MNITEALRMYLENDASPEEQIPLNVPFQNMKYIRDVLDKVRPTCDECGEDLYMQVDAPDMTGTKHPTAWICKNCGRIEYSEKSTNEWASELDEDRK